MGIHVDSPLQRQWTILDWSGSILRITATVLGAFVSSRRAVNVRVPTRILSMPNTNRPTISTHVLDTTRGETDADGRIGDLIGGPLAAGIYRMSFEVGAYYKKKALTAFLDRVTLDFEVSDAARNCHIPLLMSPFSCA